MTSFFRLSLSSVQRKGSTLKTEWRNFHVKITHRLLDTVHGIGPTIASKVVKYTLREIRLSSVNPHELYPAVKQILTEYHNARLAQELANKRGQPNIVEQIFEALVELGDPFAIDALYYVDRDEPVLKESLMTSTYNSRFCYAPARVTDSHSPTD